MKNCFSIANQFVAACLMSTTEKGTRFTRANRPCLILAMLALFASEGWATSVDWVQQVGDIGFDYGASVSADGLGSVYIAGTTTGASLVGEDAFISRYDDAGSLLWTQQFGTSSQDRGFGVRADGLGNVFIAGGTNGNLAGTNAGSSDAFLRKYDDAGNIAWTKQFGGAGYELITSLTTDASGNVYVSGAGSYDSSYSGAFVRKYNTSGNLLWEEHVGSDPDQSLGVSVDNSGNVFISGWTVGTLDGPPSTTAGSDAFLSKFDAAGNLDWTRQFKRDEGHDVQNHAKGISADNFGNVYVTGTSSAYWYWEEGSASDKDAFIAKYDETGNLIWRSWLDGDELGPDGAQNTATSLSTDDLGNVYVSGYSSSYGSGNSDAYVKKFSSAGTLLWTQELGTSSQEHSHGVSIDGMGNVFITGETWGDLAEENAGVHDVFVAKIGSPTAPVSVGVDVTGEIAGVGGDAQDPGGISVAFDNVTAVGELSGDYMEASSSEVSAVLEAVETGASNINFEIATEPAQFWEINFSGSFDNQVELTLAYDETNLLPGQLEGSLQIYHYVNGQWEVAQKISQDFNENTITVLTDSFSPFMLGATTVPEPTALMLATMTACILLHKRRRFETIATLD